MEPDSAYYDESCYPDSADSEVDHTSLLIDDSQQSLEEDFVCPVCAQVLLDPLTLHCGHNFCQLCLAEVWKSKAKPSPKTLTCPVCRLPWGNVPGVNIVLRNVISDSQCKTVEERRAAITSTEEQLIKDFIAARDGSWRLERGDATVREIRLLRGVLMVFVAVIALLVGLLVVVVWVWSGAGGAYMRKPVAKWSSEDVQEWLGGLGMWTRHNVSQIFQKEGITGSQLLLLDRQALDIIGIRAEFRQQPLLQAIEELKATEYSVPKNLHQFMNANRQLSLMIVILYKLWPRFTFAYLCVFAYEVFLPVVAYQFQTTPSSWDAEEELEWRYAIGFVLLIVLIPHYVVGSFAWVWFGVHPWIATAVIGHCVRATVLEIKPVLKAGLNTQNWKQLISRCPRDAVTSCFNFFLTYLFLSLLWPLTPHFVCDALFYFTIWHSLAVTIATLFRLRRNLINIRFQHNIRVEHNIN